MIMLGVLAAQRVIAAIVNLVTNGDFAQGGAGWTAFQRDDFSSHGANDLPDGGSNGTTVFFSNGAVRLIPAGRDYIGSGGIKRQLNVTPVPGTTYRVRFTYAGNVYAGASELILGGASVDITDRLAAPSGSVIVDVTATSSDRLFSLWSSTGDEDVGLTIDNIVVTKL